MSQKSPISLKAIFTRDGKPDFAVLGLFVLINLIVLANATLHHPKVGYDTVHHLTYIQVLLDHLPTKSDTHEYYSPPLSYALPALFDAACKWFSPPEERIPYDEDFYIVYTCRTLDGKFAQYVNWLISVATLYLILQTSELTRPGNRFYKISALALFSLLTVHYKTFSQVRPEPYVALFSAAAAYWTLRLLRAEEHPRKPAAALGISLGLLMLSRQWGAFIYLALGLLALWLFWQNRQTAARFLKLLSLSFFLSALVGGWFYAYMYVQYGTLTDFYLQNSRPMTLVEFLKAARRTNLQNLDLFKKPIRPNFDGNPTPIFYSDTWGDYWGYFTFIKEKSPFGVQGMGNAETMGAYLGRVNFFSLLPSALLGAGWLFAAAKTFKKSNALTAQETSVALFFFLASASALGFTVFTVNYFAYANNILKASYMLPFFIALVFLGANFLEALRARSSAAYYSILFLLGVVFLHNFPAFITRNILFPWF